MTVSDNLPLQPQQQPHQQPTMDRSGDVYGTILISPDNRYLLVQGRATGKWSFPKGHTEAGESPLECAKRELFEETGVYLNKLRPTSGMIPQPLSFGRYFVFRVPHKFKLCPQDTDEVMNLRWCSFQEIQRLRGNVDVSTFVRMGPYA